MSDKYKTPLARMFGRVAGAVPVLTGIKVFAGTRAQIQANFNSFTGSQFETISLGDYTLNNSYPASYAILSSDLLTKTYYDNYTFTNVLAFEMASNISDYIDNDGTVNGYFDLVKGQITGIATLVLDGVNNKWLYTTTYYDNRYQPIQSKRQIFNGTATPGTEVVNNKYDFVGKILQSKQIQTFNGITTTIDKFFTYDHAGRLLRTEQQINGDSNGKVNVAENVYNEIGQLVDKKLHGGLQSVDYKYNIRGWLSQINNPDNLANDGSSDIKGDLFAMRLNYNTYETGVMTDVNKLKFGGNITSMVWNASGKGKQAYAFAYDGMDRLYDSDYKKYIGTAWTESAAYQEDSMKYDKNGNMKKLIRTDNSGAILHNFRYVYNGNQLDSLINTVGNQKAKYFYDGNGNMKYDGIRGFDVRYNILNLPVTIKKSTDSISYIYSAAGEKLAKRMKDNSYQYYAGNMVYNSDRSLNYLLFEEGVVRKSDTNYIYEYNIKDHLGNTRVVFQPNGGRADSLQFTDYYPFGSSFAATLPNNGNKYLYNGKEKQDDVLGGTSLDWYDYGARFYDPQIGRWHVIDPSAYKYSSLSPYCYVANNPIIAIDPDGKEIVIVGGNQSQTYNDLAIIYATPLGRQMIDALQKSSQVYKIGGDAWFAITSKYKNESNRLQYYQGNADNIDGTSFRSFELLGHELFHAYQDENNQIEGRLKLGIEKGAVKFENYLRKIYSEGAGGQRLKYTGNNLFEVNEATSYDTNGEKKDPSAARSYVEINLGMGETQQKGDDKEGAAKQDNTKVQINTVQFINRVFEYMEKNKLQSVRIDF